MSVHSAPPCGMTKNCKLKEDERPDYILSPLDCIHKCDHVFIFVVSLKMVGHPMTPQIQECNAC